MKNLFDVKGKVIVITGGAGILGRGMAEYMAEQGCKVVILDRMDAGVALVEELKAKEKRILVAGSQRKITAIKAALKGEFANILVTDQYTAEELLKD